MSKRLFIDAVLNKEATCTVFGTPTSIVCQDLMKEVEVVAAIIIDDHKILCVQRGLNKYAYISKKYEFPGGKIEPGETEVEALKRELKEELCMDVLVQTKFMTVVHEYPDFKLTMHSYICGVENNELTLTEHVDFKWLAKNELEKLDWAAADVPIVLKLQNP